MDKKSVRDANENNRQGKTQMKSFLIKVKVRFNSRTVSYTI